MMVRAAARWISISFVAGLALGDSSAVPLLSTFLLCAHLDLVDQGRSWLRLPALWRRP